MPSDCFFFSVAAVVGGANAAAEILTVEAAAGIGVKDLMWLPSASFPVAENG